MNLKDNQNNNNNSFGENDDNNNNYISHNGMDQDEQKENINSIKESDLKNFLSISDKDKEDNLNNNINNNINNNNNIINNEENEDIKNGKNDNNNNNVTISNLLFQLKQMSDKQLYLLDIISNLQKTSSEQINNLNRRIKDLEEKIVKQNDDKFDFEDEDKNYTSSSDNPNFILTKLLNGNNHEELIKCLNEFRLDQIKKLDIKLIEDTLIKLCIFLTEGFKVHEIICFIKSILIINKIKLKEITKKNLKDVFNYVQQNLKNLKDEDSIDISLIISYLNN